MRMILEKECIQIIPEDEQDEVYLEAVLNLRKEHDKAIAVRVAPYGLHGAWAYLEIKKED